MGGDAVSSGVTNWAKVRLGDVTLKIGSGATPTGGKDFYLPNREKYALVRSQNVFDRRFDDEGLAFISDEQADRLNGSAVRQGDLLLNITGDGVTFLRACAVPRSVLPACVNQHVAIIRVDPAKADASYVLSFLTHPDAKHYMGSFNTGGSRRAVTKGHIESFELALPPLDEQRAIGRLLDCLDDKIELNRRMAETLEAMARALFRSWFVDFDPVHARVEGRPTGLPDDLAALFPDSFGDDGLPIGWTREPLLQHAHVTSGGTPKTEQPAYWGGPILWASAKDVSQCPDRFLLGTERTITKRGVQESATEIIPRLSTVVVARGATTGRHRILGRDMAMNQTCYALTSSRNSPYWMSCALAELVGSLLQAAHGSVFDTITIATLTVAQVMAATDVVRARFEDAVTPLFDRVLLLTEESASLQQLRETLLPKLISGELRITDAEQCVAAA